MEGYRRNISQAFVFWEQSRSTTRQLLLCVAELFLLLRHLRIQFDSSPGMPINGSHKRQ